MLGALVGIAVRSARRYQAGRLRLELLAALESWAGLSRNPGLLDPRTDRTLRTVGSLADQVLVADEVPALDALELRVVVGEATTSP